MPRGFFIFLFPFFLFLSASADDLVFSDDFESGTGLWLSNGWGLSQAYSVSPTHSFTESPFGNYPQDTVLIASMVMGADLSGYLGARLEFWARYEIEPAFDVCRVEVTRDGDFWVSLASLTGLYPFWQPLTCDLGAFAGLPDVRVRFRFYSDPLTTYDGLYIDDLKIWGTFDDISSPLIIHQGPSGYEGTPGDNVVYADIWDASGVSDEHLYYRRDSRPFEEVPRDSLVGERYYHTIPAQEAGTLVEYYFEATDASPQTYISVSDTFAYLAGRMLIFDDGLSEAILEAQPGDRAAVRFSVRDSVYVASAVVRIYTDSMHSLDSIRVYVWADSMNLPGAVIVGPFTVFPASTLDDPEAWTRVDLRPALLIVSDTFHAGLEFSTTGAAPIMALSYDVPPIYFRSSVDVGSGFQPFNFADFHIRAVVGDLTPDSLLAPGDLFGTGIGDLLYLTWSAPGAFDDLLRYEVERQGLIIGQTQYLETEYTDTLTGLPPGTYTYRVRARYSTGCSPFSDPWDYQWDTTGVKDGDPDLLPTNIGLSVFPNPTNGALCVSLGRMMNRGAISLVLYDVLGRDVARWERRASFSGVFRLDLPRDLSAGLYILEVRGGNAFRSRVKVVYLP